MKKIKYILFAALFTLSAVFAFKTNAQSTINSFTSSASFQNLDNLQNYNAIRMIAGAASAGATEATQLANKAVLQSVDGKTSQLKQKLDTINQNERKIILGLWDGGTGAKDYLRETYNQTKYTNIGVAEWTYLNKLKLDTLNQTNRSIDAKLGGAVASRVRGSTSDITNTTATDVIAAPGVGLYIYITDILVTNSHESVGTMVKIIEETSGTILWRGYAASGGGGFNSNLSTPIKLPTANKKVQVVCETTGANVVVNIAGYKGN